MVPVECGRTGSRGAETGIGSTAWGDRVCCCSNDLAVMRTSTSLESGPTISTACATADCVATDTSFTVICCVGGVLPAATAATVLSEAT